MANVRQLKDHGAPIFPITHVSLVKGMEGRALMDATYAWDGTGTPDVSKIPAGVVVTYNGTDYTGTLVASASTTGRFYLVPSTTVQGEWDRYMTDGTGSSYAWKAAGNTSIPSPDVVDNETTDDSTKSHSAAGGKRLKDQLGELEAEVTDLPHIGDTENDNADDFYITDENGNAVLSLKDGQLRTKTFDTEGTVPTISNDTSDADLNITDSNGNVIAELKGGHIKTRNFDSRDIGNIFADLDILCLGDSITWYGGDDCTGDRGWTTWFKEKAKPKSIRSFARSGATLTSLSDSTEDIEDYSANITPKNVAYNQLARIRAAYAGTPSAYDEPITAAPDIVFIAFGTNDLSRNAAFAETPASEFDGKTTYAAYAVNELLTIPKALRYICEQLYVTFPDTQIICLAPQQQANNASSGRYNGTGYIEIGDLIEECCDYLSINCIRLDKHCGTYDIREIVEDHKFPSGDSQHPNALGARENGYYIYNQTRTLLKY